jgi:hypothetical protein
MMFSSRGLPLDIIPMFTFRNYVKYEVGMDGRRLEFLPAIFRIRIIRIGYNFSIERI